MEWIILVETWSYNLFIDINSNLLAVTNNCHCAVKNAPYNIVAAKFLKFCGENVGRSVFGSRLFKILHSKQLVKTRAIKPPLSTLWQYKSPLLVLVSLLVIVDWNCDFCSYLFFSAFCQIYSNLLLTYMLMKLWFCSIYTRSQIAKNY